MNCPMCERTGYHYKASISGGVKTATWRCDNCNNKGFIKMPFAEWGGYLNHAFPLGEFYSRKGEQP